jgi:hypothetical protein
MSKHTLRTAMAVAAIALAFPIMAGPAAAKTCKSFSVAAQGEKKLTNLGARISARWHWHLKVKNTYGFAWSTYALAANKYYQCSKSGLKWRCTAHGRPCKL